MTKFNTGNPVGSADPRDFSDNAKNFDEAVNNPSSATWTDRLGKRRVTLAAQLGYTIKGDYAAGIELTKYNDVIRYEGEFYGPAAGTSLPYTTTATPPDADSNLIGRGDLVLRQDLARDPTDGNAGSLLVKGVVHSVTSRIAIKAYDLEPGSQFRLDDGAKSGSFFVVSGPSPVVDPYEGTHINLNNGNHAVRQHGQAVDRWPEIYAGWYAEGDNIANDWPALMAGFNYAKSTSKKFRFDGSKTYYLGAFPDTGKEVKFLVDVDDMTIETDGCAFRMGISIDPSHAATADQVLFEIKDASNTRIGDFHAIGDQITKEGTRVGFVPINAVSSTKNSYGLTVGRFTCEKAMAGFQCVSDDPSLYRLRNIQIAGLKNLGGYYGLNCANNGDDLTATIDCEDHVRSYFVYGVEQHKVWINSNGHEKFSDVVISRTILDTKGIKVVYRAKNDLSADEALALNFQTDDTDARIQNVEVDLDVEKSNPASKVVGFRAFDGSSNILSTTTNQFDGIRLTGRNNGNVDSRLYLGVGMTGNGRSEISLDRELFGRTWDTKGFIFRFGDGEQFATGNIGNNMELDFKIKDVTSSVPQVGRLSLVAFDNATGSSAEYVAREYWVLFSVATDGSVAIINTQLIDTFNAGSLGPSVSFPSQPAGSYSLKVRVNNYTNTNRFVKGTLKVFAYKEA